MLKFFSKLINNEEGQGLVEYALIISLIAILALAAVTGLGTEAKDIFQNITNSI